MHACTHLRARTYQYKDMDSEAQVACMEKERPSAMSATDSSKETVAAWHKEGVLTAERFSCTAHVGADVPFGTILSDVMDTLCKPQERSLEDCKNRCLATPSCKASFA